MITVLQGAVVALNKLVIAQAWGWALEATWQTDNGTPHLGKCRWRMFFLHPVHDDSRELFSKHTQFSCARHCSKDFPGMNSLTAHNNPTTYYYYSCFTDKETGA
jgi:hypothetical protein